MSILDQVIQTVAETLNIPLSSITRDSSAENTDAWDSLAQVNLMIALEQTFDITLEVEDFMKLNSVTSITAFIEENSEN
jgi:acyl carrier protein